MLTPDQTVALWQHMQRTFGSRVEEKQDSKVMQLAAVMLDALDIQDREQFMRDFVTTLYRTIYIPFNLGVAGRWDLWSQVRVCVHEHQHIVQGEREGWVVFSSRYLTSPSFRAGYEAEAYGCDLEMEFWRTGTIISPATLAASLKNYGCSPADVEMAEEMLSMRAAVVEQGVVENRASIAAIEWLTANAPDIRLIA